MSTKRLKDFEPAPDPALLKGPAPTAAELIEDVQMAEVQRLCQAGTRVAVRCLLEVAGNKKLKSEPNEVFEFEPELDENGEEVLLDYGANPRVAASRAVLEHGHGRPTQRVQHDGDRGGGITVIIEQISENTAIDVTPKRKKIEDRSSEPMEAA